MIHHPLTQPPYAGGKDLWADVDFSSMPSHTRKMVERAKLADAVHLADEAAKTAALAAQLIRATAIASEFQLKLEREQVSKAAAPVTRLPAEASLIGSVLDGASLEQGDVA